MTDPLRKAAVAAGQVWDPVLYRDHAGFVPRLGQAVVGLLDPQPGEDILDLGCGDGALTVDLVARGARVVGVDASPEQVAAACGCGLDARVMDGAALTFDHEFDAVFSNAALHWMRDPDAVIAHVARALKPGGRFVGEMGGYGNVATVIEGLLAELLCQGIDGVPLLPWYFPDVEDYGARLVRAGFRVEECDLIDRPTPLPGRLSDWLETFCGWCLPLVPVDRRRGFLEAIENRVAERLLSAENIWTVDYVRLRFKAVLP